MTHATVRRDSFRFAVVTSLLTVSSLTVSCVALSWLAVPRMAAAEDASLRHAKSLSQAFRRAAEIATPSVVTIRVTTKVQPVRGPEGKNPFKGTPFEDFFDKFEKVNTHFPFKMILIGCGKLKH